MANPDKGINGEYSGIDFLNALVENLNELIFVIGPDGLIKYASPSVQKILGYTVEEVIGSSAFRFVHPIDLPKVKADYIELIANPEITQEVSFQVLSKNGSIRRIIGNRKNHLSNPKISGIVLTIKDRTELHKSEQIRIRIEEMLSDIENITNVGGWEWDNINQDMYWTHGAFSIHGFDPPYELKGKADFIERSLSCYLEEDRPAVLSDFTDCIEKGRPYDKEYRFTSAKGNKIWIRTFAYPILSEGKTVGVRGIIKDITIKKRIEIISEARLNLVSLSYKTTVSGFIQGFIDEVERISESSIAFFHFVDDDQEHTKLTAWSSNTVKKHCGMSRHADHYPLSKAGVWADCFYTRKAVIHNDFEQVSGKKGMPDNHARVIREMVIPLIRNQKVVAILGVGNKESNYDDFDLEMLTKLADDSWEILDRLRAEENLRKNEERFRTLAENVPGVIYICKNDTDWTMLYMNTYIEALSGYSSEDFTNGRMSYSSICHPEDLITMQAEIDKAIAASSSFQICYRILNKSGEWIWVYEAGKLLYTLEHVPVLEGFIMSIDSLKKGEIALRESEIKLKQSNAEKDRYFSILGHDLKTPLSSILGFSELLQETILNGDFKTAQKYSEILWQASKHVNELLNNLIQWSLSQTGRISFEPQKVNASGICKEVIELLTPTAREKQIELSLKGSLDINVFADYKMLHSILRNLLTNAIKFTMPGGLVAISIHSTLNEVNISVSDNGVGIAEGQLSRIFHLDSNYSTLGTRNETGTGLGLMICKEFVDKHKGEINVESQQDKGSTFSIKLPATEEVF
jgi:PAS domain S-box-containing protein